MIRRRVLLAGLFLIASTAFADGPSDNVVDKVRPVPPPGIEIPANVRAELQKGASDLGKEIDELRKALTKKPALLDFLPDVQIYYNAVHYALKYNEFYSPAEVTAAKGLLQQGHERARSLRDGQVPWNSATGPVARGYRSQIDGSVQPYGLIVPASFKAGSATHHRLDLWFHGRGEKLSEVSFLMGRQKDTNLFTPDGFVLHPYGRYSNANHFAGEIDTFEAIEHARKHYRIDMNRIVPRGFSMGGAACWNFAVHYSGLWAAAQPGAGFSETPEFLRVFQNENIKPNTWERKLLHWYDCTDWAINLYQCPTVAYSGEIDKQKQAADIMGKAMLAEGLHLEHIIGPNTGHATHPESKPLINQRIDSIVAVGREAVPRKIRFTTYTLRYNKMRWVTIDGLKEHWERARVNADIVDDTTVNITTSNLTALSLAMAPGQCPLDMLKIPTVIIDGSKVMATPVLSDRSWVSHFHLTPEGWALAGKSDGELLRKRHGLQGPIDDAFMSRFIMVRPTGEPLNAKVGKWVEGEMKHAVEHWRKQFRAEITPIDDTQVDEKMIAGANLVLWGDPRSNKVLAKIADKLPIRWDVKEGVFVGKQSFDGSHHVPALIYPNPLNPKKYIVLNSGFTFREYDYLNNARQIPRLPDWAILDVNQPANAQRPAGIASAGFFGERWELNREK
jgi:pimeloyl-ACP methyl ester carboxylesterase